MGILLLGFFFGSRKKKVNDSTHGQHIWSISSIQESPSIQDITNNTHIGELAELKGHQGLLQKKKVWIKSIGSKGKGEVWGGGDVDEEVWGRYVWKEIERGMV